MLDLNIDNIIVIIFLVLTLIIGLRAGRNIKDIAEYSIANKVFGSGILAITILVTYITGSKGIGYAGYVFDDGILPIFPTIFCAVIGCFLFIIVFIIPKIKYFDGCFTTAELMGQVYGRETRFAIGILGSFYNITLVTLQIIWLGNIGELLGIPKLWSIVFGGIFLVTYSSIGGIKSITITDIIQFIAVTIMIPMITYLVLNKVGGMKSLITKIPIHHLDILHHKHSKDYLIYCTWYIFPAFPLSFPFIQRMLMARNDKQLRDSYYISMFFLIIFFVLLTLIGLSSIVLQETLDANMPNRGSQIITYLINNYFVHGAKGILIVGLIAAVISTADSFLNSAGLLLAHDVIKPTCNRKGINIDELKLVRCITFFLGILAIFLAFVNNVLPRIQYAGVVDLGKGINIASEIVALIFTVPLIAGIIGLKGNSFSFFIPTIITTVTFISGKLFFDNLLLIPISIIVNLISFFITHYILHKGFVMVKRDNTFVEPVNSLVSSSYPNKLFTALKSFPKKLISYSQSHIESYDDSHTKFALFMAFNYMLPFFMYSYSESNLYQEILFIRIIGGSLCIGLLLKAYWPHTLKVYFQTYYYLTIFYCLPFSTTMIFLLEKGSIEWLINITLAITLLIILVDWVLFTILSTAGILLAAFIYYMLFNDLQLANNDVIYGLVYIYFFSTIISIIFVRKRQQYLRALFNNRQELRDLHNYTTDKLVDALNYQEKIVSNLGKEGLEILKQVQKITGNLCKQITLNSNETFTEDYSKLTSITKYLEEIITQAKDYIRLEVSSIDINLLLKEINIKWIKVTNKPILIFLNKAQHKTIECDINLIKRVVINTIYQTQEYSLNKNEIYVNIDFTELWYRLDSIKNYTKKIPAIRFVVTTLEEIGELPNFYMGDTMKAAFTLSSKQDLYKSENIKIINAHYGVLQYSEHYITFVIPLHIRDIRPKSMDLEESSLALQGIITDSLKEKKIEAELITEIRKQNPNINIQKIDHAINLIRKYHAKQKRKSGEAFYLHPLAVTKILLQFTSDEDALLAALLHDIVEDTPMSLSKIEAIFNPTVAKLVDGLTKFDQSRKKLNLSEHENIQKLIEQVDKRVLMIKIADRIHNMYTITGHSSYKKQKSISEQTLQFYIPIAKELGMHKAVIELQRLVFEILNKSLFH